MIVSLGMVSCSKDQDTIIDTVEETPGPAVKVYATINGLIQDEFDNSLSNAVVQIDNESTTTDENGYFALTGYFNELGAYIKVSKNGYFDGNGTILPVADSGIYIKVKMVLEDQKVNGLSSNVINFQDGAVEVLFNENIYLDEANNAYNGNVEIVGKYFDPSDADFSYIFPGSFNSIVDNEQKIIQPFGVLNLEIMGDSGMELDVSGEVSITMEIPNAMQSIAPNEISLWYLDENTGLLVRDGSAVRNGNQYVGTVTHFTIWVFGVYYEGYKLSGTITAGGKSYANGLIQAENEYTTHYTRAASNGQYSMYTIAETDFDLKVLNACGEEIYNEFVSGINEDTNKDVAIVEPINYFSFSGTVNCNGSPVANSYLIAYLDDLILPDVYLTNNGNFEILLENCSTSQIPNLKLVAYDVDNGTVGEAVEVNTEGVFDIEICEEETVGGYAVVIISDQENRTINNVTVDIKESVVDGYDELIYNFTFIDNYSNISDIEGASAAYSYFYSTIEEIDEIIYGPIMLAQEMSDNVPFNYWFTVTEIVDDLPAEDGFLRVNLIGTAMIFDENGTSFDSNTTESGSLTLEVYAKIQ